MGLFRKDKIGIIAKFYRTDLVILSHSRGTENPSYSQINTVLSYIKQYSLVASPFFLSFELQICQTTGISKYFLDHFGIFVV